MNYIIVEYSHIVPAYKLMSWIIRNIIGNFRNDFQLWKPDVVNNCQVINCWLRHNKNFPKIWSKNIHFIYCMHPNLTILNNLQNVLVRVKCVRMQILCALADLLSTKLGIILSFFLFLSFHLLCGNGVRALWESEDPLCVHKYFKIYFKIKNISWI